MVLLPILAAAATLVLGERPPQLVKPGQAAAYAAWLRGQTLEADAHFTGKAVCSNAKVTEAKPALVENLPAQPNGYGGAVVIERLDFSGCGHAWRMTMAVGLESGGDWTGTPMLPGDSHAGFTLQNDVLTSLLPRLQNNAPGCPRLDWSEVKILTPPDKTGAWTEAWSINACGKPFNLALTFTPTADGGTDFAVKSR